MMNDSVVYWAFYTLFLLVRIPANVKRCRIPLMRGQGYFFNTRVPDGFFDGPGRDILRRYRLWIVAPFALDAAALALIYRSGATRYLLYLALADVAIALVNHTAALKRSIREARAFEIEPVPRASAVAFSLTTRRLRDYTSVRLELIIASMNLAVVLSLWHEPAELLGLPMVLFYLQLGLELLKYALIAGRTLLPSEGAEQYLQWRESYRRLLTDSCDSVRLMVAASVALATSGLDLRQTFIAVLVMLPAWTIWYWRRVRSFMETYRRALPVILPSALEPEASVPPMICFRPNTPLSFVKGTRGWALNLANRRSQVGVAYLIGLVAVPVLLLR
jgi:hypothetical protein